ncbi:MAG: S8 family serine peptidase [Actinomycetaceae bacterium]|nr:S8 family serine peptidase [Actinomycetaceae bacterium]
MKATSRILAGVTGLALAFTPAAAFAAPDESKNPSPETPPALPSNVFELLEKSDSDVTTVAPETESTQKVMVLLTGQPKTPGNELARLAEVEDLITKWKDKYQLQPDRSFGYLVKGFSATIPTEKIAELKAEPRVRSVQPVKTYYPIMETAAELTQSVSARSENQVDGAGIVVSIIDTGIDPSHQDMRLDDGVATKLDAAAGFTAKVPYGYNFADENTTIVDTTASQHGMHVAGIVAANGGEEANVSQNGRIKGVAPNAQLLAMKVFSNDPAKGRGAAGDDIIAAIEESVKQGADIINMSLGSANGLVSDESGEQRAIMNAVNAGVEVIVAAGNEGLSSSVQGNTVDFFDKLDDGSVGSPSTGSGAISVASVNNSASVQTVAMATAGTDTLEVAYDLQNGTRDDAAHKLVYGQVGKPEQIPDTAKDNYVLIERGELTFADKVSNALAKGAVGVVIYNHSAGGDEIPGMGGINSFEIPVAGMGHSDGQSLADAINAGKEVTIKFTDDRKIVPTANSLEPSSFTSWGSTSDLSFKPQLAGIGGNVYSTLNGDKYGMMSGTSMAAPHVAGVTALMREEMAKKYPTLSAVELNERIRVALANTAKILTTGDSVPYSARQMGAGLVQTKDAMDTSVFATVDDSPWVELKEVNGSQTRTVTLTNTGVESLTFNTGGTCVVNETNGTGEAIETSCSAVDSLSVAADTVTVPAGGQTTVDFTVTADSGQAHWVSGWVKFESQNPAQPSLSIPYLGFAGNWNAEPIVDSSIYGDEIPFLSQVLGRGNITYTALMSRVNGKDAVLRPGQTVISPNGDGLKDQVFPALAMLRNARKTEVSVLNESGEVVRKLGTERNLSRPMLSHYIENPEINFSETLTAHAFDGKVWNPQLAAFEVVPDGNYTMRIESTLAEGWNPQVTDMGFTVDTVAPTVTVESVGDPDADDVATIRLKVTDEVGLLGGNGFIAIDSNNGLQMDATKVAGQEGTFDLRIENASSLRYVSINAIDMAGNITEKTVFLNESALIIDTPVGLDVDPINDRSISGYTGDPYLQDGQILVAGKVRADVTTVSVNGEETAVEDGSFATWVAVSEGSNEVTVEAKLADGTVAQTTTVTVVVDNTAPELTITSPDTSAPVELENGSVTVTGTVSDNLAQIDSVRVDGQDVAVTDGKFTANVTPDESVSAFAVVASDGVNVTNQVIALAREATADNSELKLDANVDPKKRFNFVEPDSADVTVEDGGHVLDFYGTFNRVPSLFEVDGKAVEVAPDGSFSTPVPLKQGITSVNVKIVDVDGRVDFDSKLKILFDSKVPGFDLTSPNIHEDGALYRQDTSDVKFAGEVWDNAFGYSLTLNGNVVEDFFDIDDPSPVANRKSFESDVPVADGDHILLGLYDQAGNAYLQLIPVIIDAIAPELNISGVENGQTIPSTQEITVRTEDPHLQDLKVMLDGQEVNTVITNYVTAPGAEIYVDGEPDPGFPTTVGANRQANTVAANDSADEVVLSKSQLEDKATADVSNVEETDAPAAPSGEGYTVLTLKLDNPLAAGDHDLVATSTDKAGNRSDTAVSFRVDDAPSIVGPDALTVDPNKDIDQQIRDAYQVVDDLDKDLELAFDSSDLVEGETVELVLSVTDSAGNVTTRTVQVTVQAPAPVVPDPSDPDPVVPDPVEPGPVRPAPADPTDLPTVPGGVNQSGSSLAKTGTEAGILVILATVFGAGGLGLVMVRRRSHRQ